MIPLAEIVFIVTFVPPLAHRRAHHPPALGEDGHAGCQMISGRGGHLAPRHKKSRNHPINRQVNDLADPDLLAIAGVPSDVKNLKSPVSGSDPPAVKKFDGCDTIAT